MFRRAAGRRNGRRGWGGLISGGLNASGLTARVAALAGGICLAAAAVGLVAGRIARARQEMLRHVNRICQTDIQDFLTGDPTESWPPLPDSNFWRSTIGRLQEFLRSVAEKLREDEHARARAEVRCRRLALERRQMAEILAGLNEPVLAIDQFDEVVFTNPSAERLFQLADRRDGRRPLSNLVRCEELVSLLTETRRRKAPAQKTGEIEIEDPDGGSGWYRVTARHLNLSQDGAGADGGNTRARLPCCGTWGAKRTARNATPSSSPRSATR